MKKKVKKHTTAVENHIIVMKSLRTLHDGCGFHESLGCYAKNTKKGGEKGGGIDDKVYE
jgi:hypothetical protein